MPVGTPRPNPLVKPETDARVTPPSDGQALSGPQRSTGAKADQSTTTPVPHPAGTPAPVHPAGVSAGQVVATPPVEPFSRPTEVLPHPLPRPVQHAPVQHAPVQHAPVQHAPVLSAAAPNMLGPAEPEPGGSRSRASRFAPWLVPLVLTGAVVIGTALIANNRGSTDQVAEPQREPVPGRTMITLGPPSDAVPPPPPLSVAPSGVTRAAGQPVPSAASAPRSVTPKRTPSTPAAAATTTPGKTTVVTGKPNTAGANLALGRPASASSQEDGRWPASMAVDGDAATRWSSEFSDPQWLLVDLGDVWAVSTVNLTWERSHATTYRVEVSVDGTTWTTVYTTTSGVEGDTLISAGKVPGRYVKVVGTARSNGYGYSLYEIRVS
ncbi:discoidin domain-containing protein [Actinoplanes derwentensis]|uniref:discoidin domain-containing protein n=1 Tax=Actinoplanes derwentensis TaxID=113562 RepID=UPI000A8FD1DC|nr:discoidin domain-containing protein [Actinoplanes derwentensis]